MGPARGVSEDVDGRVQWSCGITRATPPDRKSSLLCGNGDAKKLRRANLNRHLFAVSFETDDVHGDGFLRSFPTLLDGRALGEAPGKGGHGSP